MILSQCQAWVILLGCITSITCLVAAVILLYRHLYNSVSGYSRKNYSDTRTVHKDVKPAAKGYRYPFSPFPRGWFFVAQSSEIHVGDVKPLQYLGLDLVIFRGENQVVSVLSAHCPHMGAHMGCGGTVQGDNIQCPFHAWRFDGTGQCVSIPYSEKIPKGASVKSYLVKEQNGLIFFFYDGDVDKIEPFDLPKVDEFDTNPKWTGFALMWRCRAHLQEVAENAVDTGHFNIVHGFGSKPIIHELETDGRKFKVHFSTLRTTLGMTDNAHLHISYYGLGVSQTHVESRFLRMKFIICSTPIDKEHTEVNIFGKFEKTNNFIRNWIMQWYLPFHIGNDFHADIPVWENKIYKAKPLLCRGDGPIPAIRRWAKQFYEEGLDF